MGQNRTTEVHETGRKQRILLLGASGGLGRALARQYAAPGVDLCLWGRDLARLEAVAGECRERGARASWHAQDICNWQEAVRHLVDQDASAPFDLAIFSSGNGEVRAPHEVLETPELVHNSINVNFAAPAALAVALAERMMTRRRGQVVLIGSAASFHALPFASAYAGSKAGLARFGAALDIAARPHGVAVTVVSPGFIDTAARGDGPRARPFEISPDAAAEFIVRAVARRSPHVTFPKVFLAAKMLDRVMPRVLRDCLLRSLKPPAD